MANNVIVYKGFSFPYNPTTTEFNSDRLFAEHKYPELFENDVEDFGSGTVTISGTGAFFGKNSKEQWDRLLSEYNKIGVGTVYHPYFTNITKGLMTKLRATIEPMPDYVEYYFEIVADTSVKSDGGDSVSVNADFVIKHTFKKGEKLKAVVKKYATLYNVELDYKKVATDNNIKKINKIAVDTIITIIIKF